VCAALWQVFFATFYKRCNLRCQALKAEKTQEKKLFKFQMIREKRGARGVVAQWFQFLFNGQTTGQRVARNKLWLLINM